MFPPSLIPLEKNYTKFMEVSSYPAYSELNGILPPESIVFLKNKTKTIGLLAIRIIGTLGCLYYEAKNIINQLKDCSEEREFLGHLLQKAQLATVFYPDAIKSTAISARKPNTISTTACSTASLSSQSASAASSSSFSISYPFFEYYMNLLRTLGVVKSDAHLYSVAQSKTMHEYFIILSKQQMLFSQELNEVSETLLKDSPNIDGLSQALKQSLLTHVMGTISQSIGAAQLVAKRAERKS